MSFKYFSQASAVLLNKNVNFVSAALCDSPETPENAYIQEELREFISGMSVTYKCKDNFVIEGPNKRKCLPNGQWSSVPPTCKGKYAFRRNTPYEDHA